MRGPRCGSCVSECIVLAAVVTNFKTCIIDYKAIFLFVCLFARMAKKVNFTLTKYADKTGPKVNNIHTNITITPGSTVYCILFAKMKIMIII